MRRTVPDVGKGEPAINLVFILREDEPCQRAHCRAFAVISLQPAAKPRPRQVIDRPARLPWNRKIGALLAQRLPDRIIIGDGRAQQQAQPAQFLSFSRALRKEF